MAKSIRKRLKSTERSERYTAIDELASSGTESDVVTLKHVAEGRRRGWLTHYDFNDQIYAMEQLVNIGTPDIAQYLNHFLKEQIKHVDSGVTNATWLLDYPGEPPKTWARLEHIFPNACGELGKRLYWSEEDYTRVGRAAAPGKDLTSKDNEAHEVRETLLQRINQT